jgi:hypothetical protein
MFSESRFSDLTDSLASGFFADDVIMVLARYGKTRSLNEKDEPVLQRAVRFLERVLEGHDWMDKPEVSRNSMESAKAFSRAVRATTHSLSSKLFVEYIENLLNVAKQLVSEKTADATKAERLREFFGNYGRTELVRTENILEDTGLETFR